MDRQLSVKHSEPVEYLKEKHLPKDLDRWIAALVRDQPVYPRKYLIRLLSDEEASDEETIICENSWCEQKVRISQVSVHAEECRKGKWRKCARCAVAMERSCIPMHERVCHPERCELCGELVLKALINFCPKSIPHNHRRQLGLSQTITVPESLSPKGPGAGEQKQASKIQRAWRSAATRARFINLTFGVIWNLMDVAKEKDVGTCVEDSVIDDEEESPFLSKSAIGDSWSTIDVDCVKTWLEKIRRGGRIPRDDVMTILEGVRTALLKTPSVVQVETPRVGQVIVVGDLHGQRKDLLHILDTYGLPSENLLYVFNGDFVDRGSYGCEVLFLLYAMLFLYPGWVVLVRGNHEDRKINKEYGFLAECSTKYDEELYNCVVRTFKYLPLMVVIDKRVLVVHGGLPRSPFVIEERFAHPIRLANIPSVQQEDEDDQLVVDLVWSDPVETFRSRQLGAQHQGGTWRTNKRGCGIEFTKDHSKKFLQMNDLEYVIRSHEMVDGGYREHHEGYVFTVFSASNYCGVSSNRGGVAIIQKSGGRPTFQTWYLQDDSLHPLLDPHRGALNMRKLDDEVTCARVDVLRTLREQIWMLRHQLMHHFTRLDHDTTGTISRVEWCHVMNVALHQALPWFYLSRHLAPTSVTDEHNRIMYVKFLKQFDNKIGKKLFEQWVLPIAARVLCPLEIPGDFQLGMCDDIISYETFSSVIRTKSPHSAILNDSQMFQLFCYFDKDNKGHIDVDVLEAELEGLEDYDDDAKSSMILGSKLQDLFTFGRPRGLESIFQCLDQDESNSVDFTEFRHAFDAINKCSLKPLTNEQMVEIFKTIDADGNGSINYREFVESFTIYQLSS
eukprot:PhF_6_TR26203/c0_g1_i1/m.37311/K04460/PPP5C; serine/threonine-protein phosphatase 5